MDPDNNVFFWPSFLRYINMDKYSEKNIPYNTSHYFKGEELNPNLTWLLAKNRRHKMFIRKCADVIEPYEACVENKFWRFNIDHYIEEPLRKKCYLDWIKVRRCSDNFLGEDFTTLMEIGREVNFARKMEADREKQEYFDRLQKRKLELFGPDHLVRLPEEGEGGSEEEEEEEE